MPMDHIFISQQLFNVNILYVCLHNNKNFLLSANQTISSLQIQARLSDLMLKSVGLGSGCHELAV